ncbi:hypothetical protein TWF281_000345 [Arthrobotrys megalospora]
MAPNNRHYIHPSRLQNVPQGSDDDDIILFDPPTPPTTRHFDHFPQFTILPQTTDPIKRPASAPPIYSEFSPLYSIPPKRPRLSFGESTTDHLFFDMDEDLLPGNSSDWMNVDIKPNTRQFRRRLLRAWPPYLRGFLGREDPDSSISFEDSQILQAVEESKMYRTPNIVLTEREQWEAIERAETYKKELDSMDLPEAHKQLLKKRAQEKFELLISWEKTMNHLKNIQLDRGSRMEWTELGLPQWELIQPSKSLPNLKVVASVKTKGARSSLKGIDKMEEDLYSSQSSQQLADQKQSRPGTPSANAARYLAKKAHISSIIPELSGANAAAAETEASEAQQKAEIQRMLAIREAYIAKPRAVTPPNLHDQTSNSQSQTNTGSFFSYDHLKRFNKEFKKDAQNSFSREQRIRDDIRARHGEYNHQMALGRQNNIWYTPAKPGTPAKPRTWESVPADQVQYYTFSVQELIDDEPELRWHKMRHNEMVEASGLRKGDFEYKRNGPYGNDPYMDQLTVEDDLGSYV